MKKKLTFFDIINNDDMETNKNENHEIEKVQSFLNQIKTINDSYERVKMVFINLSQEVAPVFTRYNQAILLKK